MNSATIDHELTPKSRRFRIQDNGNALWMMTAVLLVAGYVAIRSLTSAADAPQVEVSTPAKLIEQPSQATSPSDDALHKLRPQTLQGDSHLGSYPLPSTSGPVVSPAMHWDDSAFDGWNEPPANWSPSLDAERVGAAGEREVLR